jgi:hypothetical protein
MKQASFILFIFSIIPTGVFSSIPPHNISTQRLFFNKKEIANSLDTPPGKMITAQLDPATFQPTDTLHFTWQMDFISDDTLVIDLYLGKEKTSLVPVSSEKSTGFYYGKFAASRVKELSDSLGTTNLFLHFSMERSKPQSIIKIKLKD